MQGRELKEEKKKVRELQKQVAHFLRESTLGDRNRSHIKARCGAVDEWPGVVSIEHPMAPRQLFFSQPDGKVYIAHPQQKSDGHTITGQ